MSHYRCERCGVTHRYDRSWHKNPPQECGRCIRVHKDKKGGNKNV